MATTTEKIKDTAAKMETKGTEVMNSAEAKVSSIGEGRRAEGWTTQVQEGATQIADKAKDVAASYASQAKEFATDAGKKVTDFASNAAEKTTDTVKEYPLQSLLVGFGVGCLVGLLIPRR